MIPTDLDPRDVRPLDEAAIPAAVGRLVHLLGGAPAATPEDARRALRSLLTRRAPGTIPAAAWPDLDGLWAAERARVAVTRAMDLPALAASGEGARVHAFRGDITTLDAGAIVNAANAGLTGCYEPFHACVDNAIHTAAGPRLREACGAIMAARGRPEPTATATATTGAFLPARHVLHTVGPIVRGGAPTERDAALLARCYAECLAAAVAVGAESVAFSSLSTGVFGYPIRAAAPVAIAATRAFLAAHAPALHVVFVTYSASDEATYRTALTEAFHG